MENNACEHSRKSLVTQYRQIKLFDKDFMVYGFGLWYRNEESARAFFDMILKYFECGQMIEKEIDIYFLRDRGEDGKEFKYNLKVEILVDKETFIAEVDGIQSSYVAEIEKTLGEYGYSYLVTGYTDEKGEEKVIPDCVYSFSKVSVDGFEFIGTNKRKFPLHLVEELIRPK